MNSGSGPFNTANFLPFQQFSSFGAWLEYGRKALGWTQEQMANHLRYSRSMYRALEANARHANREAIQSLVDLFHIPPVDQRAFTAFAQHPAAAFVVPAPAHPNLFGRVYEEQVYAALLRERGARLYSLVGPPGVGKTRLSLALADQVRFDFVHGVFFVALAVVRNDQAVIPAIVQTVRKASQNLAGSPSLDLLLNYLRDKDVLLILDNTEHLPALRSLVQELVTNAPQLTILTTGRSALHSRGEYLLAVPSLELPAEAAATVEQVTSAASVQLFLERVRAARRTLKPSRHNVALLTGICRQLDGLPLALELAAARARQLSFKEIFEGLSDRLALLSEGPAWDDPRHRSLRATFDWSYELLSAAEQMVLSRLAVCVGGCNITAAEKIANPDHAIGTPIRTVMHALVDHNLLIASNDEAAVEPRFTMLETIRVYALDKLAVRDDRELVEATFCQYYANVATSVGTLFQGTPDDQWRAFETFDAERANIDQGWAWVRDRAGANEEDRPTNYLVVQYAVGLNRIGSIRYVNQARVQQYETALGVARRLQQVDQEARFLNTLGATYIDLGEVERGITLVQESLEIARDHEDRKAQMLALGNLGWGFNALGNTSRARQALEEQLALAQQSGDRDEEAVAYGNLGSTAYYEGDIPQAETHFRQFWLLVHGRDAVSEIEALGNVGAIALMRGRREYAIEYVHRSLRLARRMHNEPVAVRALINLSTAYLELERVDRAERLVEFALHCGANLEDPTIQGLAHTVAAQIALKRADLSTARTALRTAHRHFKAAHNLPMTYSVAHVLGEYYVAVPNERRAIVLLMWVYRKATAAQYTAVAAESAWVLGLLLLRRAEPGDRAQGLSLLEICLAYLRQIQHMDLKTRQAQYDAVRADLAAHP